VPGMDSDKVKPASEPTPVQGHPTAKYSVFEKLLRKTAKILRQSH